jgi:tetratricopeptide (TPR) repeat protein
MAVTARDADQRSVALNLLGTALRTLGERESGTARLQEAVTAYRAALQETTSERVPLQWAATQNNLGIALRTLGARESGTARLEEAVTAFDACLMVTASIWPSEWVNWVRARQDETRAEMKRRMAK